LGLAGTSVGHPVQRPCRSRVTQSRLHRTSSVFQRSVLQAGPKAEGNSFFQNKDVFSSIRCLLHPDLEMAAFHQQTYDLFVFPNLQSTLRSFKMNDATEIPSRHIFIILAMSSSGLKSGNLVPSLLLLLSLSQVILGKHSHARTL